MLLACMRMICDTPAILDPTCRISPKLEELERVLGDLLEEPDRKVIVFSEWERMLEMVRELAGEMGDRGGLAHGLGAAAAPARGDRPVQAGPGLPAVPVDRQRQRRTQSAGGERRGERRSAVESGQARAAHRAGLAQGPDARRSTVVNLVCEDSIEHGMLHLLGAQAGAGRRRARRPGRSRGAQDAVRARRHDRAHAGDDAGRRERCGAAHRCRAGRGHRRGIAAAGTASARC